MINREIQTMNITFYDESNQEEELVYFHSMPCIPFKVGDVITLGVENKYPELWTPIPISGRFSILSIEIELTKTFPPTKYIDGIINAISVTVIVKKA